MCKQCQGLKHSRPKSKVLVTSAGRRASEPERNSAAVCAKRYFTEAQEDGYSWHSHLCSAARRWGRHTVNCRQNRKAESCEICILTAAVYKCQEPPPYKMIHWKPEKVRERILEGRLTLVQTGGRQKLHEETFLISELAVLHQLCNFLFSPESAEAVLEAKPKIDGNYVLFFSPQIFWNVFFNCAISWKCTEDLINVSH